MSKFYFNERYLFILIMCSHGKLYFYGYTCKHCFVCIIWTGKNVQVVILKQSHCYFILRTFVLGSNIHMQFTVHTMMIHINDGKFNLSTYSYRIGTFVQWRTVAPKCVWVWQANGYFVGPWFRTIIFFNILGSPLRFP